MTPEISTCMQTATGVRTAGAQNSIACVRLSCKVVSSALAGTRYWPSGMQVCYCSEFMFVLFRESAESCTIHLVEHVPGESVVLLCLSYLFSVSLFIVICLGWR